MGTTEMNKFEIPEDVYDRYCEELGSRDLPRFYGPAIKYLIKKVSTQKRALDTATEAVNEATNAIKEAQKTKVKNTIAEALALLQKAGFKVRITAEEK